MKTKILSPELLCKLTPGFVEGDEPEEMHKLMAGTLGKAIEGLRQIQCSAGICA